MAEYQYPHPLQFHYLPLNQKISKAVHKRCLTEIADFLLESNEIPHCSSVISIVLFLTDGKVYQRRLLDGIKFLKGKGET